jgi:hypothetical protein
LFNKRYKEVLLAKGPGFYEGHVTPVRNAERSSEKYAAMAREHEERKNRKG